MEELNDFLNCSSKFQRVTIPGGYVNGKAVPKPEVFQNPPKREYRGDEYAEVYRKKEMDEMIKVQMKFFFLIILFSALWRYSYTS